MNSPDKPNPSGPDPAPLTQIDVLPLTVLGLDMGEARIGVAVKPANQSMALPLDVIRASPERHAFDRILELIRDRGVKVVVVGLPVHDDATQANKIKRTVRRLRTGVRGVRWRFHDETLSSAAAAEVGIELGEGRRAAPDDDRAAALILEDFLLSLPES